MKGDVGNVVGRNFECSFDDLGPAARVDLDHEPIDQNIERRDCSSRPRLTWPRAEFGSVRQPWTSCSVWWASVVDGVQPSR